MAGKTEKYGKCLYGAHLGGIKKLKNIVKPYIMRIYEYNEDYIG